MEEEIMGTERILWKGAFAMLIVLLIAASAFLVSAVQNKKSQEEAIQIATTVAEGTVTSTGHGISNGNDVYYVETSDGTIETEIEIDATTGEILNIEQESEDDENEVKVSSDNAEITEEEAKEIAVAETGGKVTEVDTDRKNGRDAWEIEIKKDGNYADVLIDMETGEVLAVEWEDSDDE